MAENEYTPTVGVAASRYSAGRLALDPEASRIAPSERDAEFDRMLAQVRAEAKAEALREHAKRLRYWTRDESQKRLRFSVDNAVADLEEEAARIDRTTTETTNGDSDE